MVRPLQWDWIRGYNDDKKWGWIASPEYDEKPYTEIRARTQYRWAYCLHDKFCRPSGHFEATTGPEEVIGT